MGACSTNDPGILVGIVTLNRIEKLRQTLAQCRGAGFDKCLVVDNGSSDGTREFLADQDDVTTILNESNSGGSGGFNRIMRFFFSDTSYRFLLLMDDDAYPAFTREQLVTFLARRQDSNYMAYACRVVYQDGTLCEMNRPGKNVLVHHPLSQFKRDFHISESTGEQVVDFAGFVGLLLTREAVARNGIVSSHFFIYSDDTYYTLSISRNSGKILYCPQLTFVHDCQRSSRNLLHHNPMRLERDVVNKIVLIREYSRFRYSFLFLYLARLLWLNPKRTTNILRAAYKGLFADLSPYRNQVI